MLRSSNRLLLLQLAARRANAAPALASAAAAASVIDSTAACSTSARWSPPEERRDSWGRDCSIATGGACGVGVVGALRAFHASAAPRSAFTMPSPTQLDAVMRMETLVDRTADEIEDIWMTYHGGDPAAAATEAAAAAASGSGEDGAAAPAAPQQPPPPPPAGEHCVGTVLSADEYKVLSARAKASPMFVLPLRKTVVRRRKEGEQGADAAAADAAADPSSPSSPPAYLTLLLQWQLPLLLVTTVDEYRRLGPNAPPHLVATFYPQLADSKGIVLARGDLTGGGSGAGGKGAGGGGAVTSRAEARTVLELARAFYTDGEMHQLAYKFNHDQQAFDFNELLRALGLEGAAPVAAGAE